MGDGLKKYKWDNGVWSWGSNDVLDDGYMGFEFVILEFRYICILYFFFINIFYN